MIANAFRTLLLVTSLLLSTSCSRHPCPACPRPVTPAPVAVVKERPPCPLPTLPQPFVLSPIEDPNDRDLLILRRERYVELHAYLRATRDWIVEAVACLRGTP